MGLSSSGTSLSTFGFYFHINNCSYNLASFCSFSLDFGAPATLHKVGHFFSFCFLQILLASASQSLVL